MCRIVKSGVMLYTNVSCSRAIIRTIYGIMCCVISYSVMLCCMLELCSIDSNIVLYRLMHSVIYYDFMLQSCAVQFIIALPNTLHSVAYCICHWCTAWHNSVSVVVL